MTKEDLKIILDSGNQVVEIRHGGIVKTLPLYSKESLELLSEIWIKVQWNELHWHSLSWMGLPIWQLPEDLLRLQEILWEIAPDVIVETGVNKGGSTVFFASLCRILGKGKVISVDIQLPEDVRKSIQDHPLSPWITLIEGDSTTGLVFEEVKRQILPEQKVFVFLDSDHSKKHVTAELELYNQIVTKGSYIVACDGVMEKLSDVPKGDPTWATDNPAAAVREFLKNHPEFLSERPCAKFNNCHTIQTLTYWPDAWLKRVD